MSVLGVFWRFCWAAVIAVLMRARPRFSRVALSAAANAFVMAIARFAVGAVAVIVRKPVSGSAEAVAAPSSEPTGIPSWRAASSDTALVEMNAATALMFDDVDDGLDVPTSELSTLVCGCTIVLAWNVFG